MEDSAAQDGGLRRSGRERKSTGVTMADESGASDYEDSGREQSSSDDDNAAPVVPVPGGRKRGRPRKEPVYRPSISPAVIKGRMGPPKIIPSFVPAGPLIDLVPPPPSLGPVPAIDCAAATPDFAARAPVAVVNAATGSVHIVTAAAYAEHRDNLNKLIAAAEKSFQPVLVPPPVLLPTDVPSKRTVTRRGPRSSFTLEQLTRAGLAPADADSADPTASAAAGAGADDVVELAVEEPIDEDEVRAEEMRVMTHNVRQEGIHARMVALERADHIAALRRRVTHWLPDDLPADARAHTLPLGGRDEPDWPTFAAARSVATPEDDCATAALGQSHPSALAPVNDGEIAGEGRWPAGGYSVDAAAAACASAEDVTPLHCRTLRRNSPLFLSALGLQQMTLAEFDTLFAVPGWSHLETVALCEFVLSNNNDSWPLVLLDPTLSVRHTPASCEARFCTLLALASLYGRDLTSAVIRGGAGALSQGIDVPVILPPLHPNTKPRDLSDKYLKGYNRIASSNPMAATGIAAAAGPNAGSQSHHYHGSSNSQVKSEGPLVGATGPVASGPSGLLVARMPGQSISAATATQAAARLSMGGGGRGRGRKGTKNRNKLGLTAEEEDEILSSVTAGGARGAGGRNSGRLATKTARKYAEDDDDDDDDDFGGSAGAGGRGARGAGSGANDDDDEEGDGDGGARGGDDDDDEGGYDAFVPDHRIDKVLAIRMHEQKVKLLWAGYEVDAAKAAAQYAELEEKAELEAGPLREAKEAFYAQELRDNVADMLSDGDDYTLGGEFPELAEDFGQETEEDEAEMTEDRFHNLPPEEQAKWDVRQNELADRRQARREEIRREMEVYYAEREAKRIADGGAPAGSGDQQQQQQQQDDEDDEDDGSDSGVPAALTEAEIAALPVRFVNKSTAGADAVAVKEEPDAKRFSRRRFDVDAAATGTGAGAGSTGGGRAAVATRQYLVKDVGMSYQRAKWLSEVQMRQRYGFRATQDRVKRFTTKREEIESMNLDRFGGAHFDPRFLEVDRVLMMHVSLLTETQFANEADGRTPEACRATRIPRFMVARVAEDGRVEVKPPEVPITDPANLPATNADESISDTDRVAVPVYLVKWAGLGYSQATWEFACDIKDEMKVAQYRRFARIPSAAQLVEQRQFTEEQLHIRKLRAARWYKESPKFKTGHALRDYQIQGINWLIESYLSGKNGILADEMGLGKTIQCVAFLEHLRREEGMRGPFLIVAPLSTLTHWKREAEGWTDMNAVVYHDAAGGANGRRVLREYEFYYPGTNVVKFNILITSYEMLLTDLADLELIRWKYVIIDEGHRLKNKTARLMDAFAQLQIPRRLLLTGTPIQNNTTELWTLLNFVEPERFYSQRDFEHKYKELDDAKKVDQLQRTIAPYILRRMKESVEKSIPPKEETVIDVELTTLQKKYYRAIFDKNAKFLRQGVSSGNVPKLINIVSELRKVCNHPWMVAGTEEREIPADSTAEDYFNTTVQASGKLVLLDKLLPKLYADKHVVLIFSQFVMLLDILEDYLKHRGWRYERLDGSITGDQREAAIDRFSRADSDRFVFLLTTRAGGVGLNLTRADTVIIFDSDWNPQMDVQAQARAHRIGQKNAVSVYRLVTRNTYESQLFARASKKLGLDHAVLRKLEAGAEEREDTDDIVRILKLGAYGLMDDQDDEQRRNFFESDIDSILLKNTHVISNKPAASAAAGDDDTAASGAQEDKKTASSGGIVYSKQYFSAEDSETSKLDINDANFWDQVLGRGGDSARFATEALLSRLTDGSATASAVAREDFFSDLKEGVSRALEGSDGDAVDNSDEWIGLLIQFGAMSVFPEKQRREADMWLTDIDTRSMRRPRALRDAPPKKAPPPPLPPGVKRGRGRPRKNPIPVPGEPAPAPRPIIPAIEYGEMANGVRVVRSSRRIRHSATAGRRLTDEMSSDDDDDEDEDEDGSDSGSGSGAGSDDDDVSAAASGADDNGSGSGSGSGGDGSPGSGSDDYDDDSGSDGRRRGGRKGGKGRSSSGSSKGSSASASGKKSSGASSKRGGTPAKGSAASVAAASSKQQSRRGAAPAEEDIDYEDPAEKRRALLAKRRAALAENEERGIPTSMRRGGRSGRPQYNQHICSRCHAPGQLIACDGPCLRVFHAECLPRSEPLPGTFATGGFDAPTRPPPAVPGADGSAVPAVEPAPLTKAKPNETKDPAELEALLAQIPGAPDLKTPSAAWFCSECSVYDWRCFGCTFPAVVPDEDVEESDGPDADARRERRRASKAAAGGCTHIDATAGAAGADSGEAMADHAAPAAPAPAAAGGDSSLLGKYAGVVRFCSVSSCGRVGHLDCAKRKGCRFYGKAAYRCGGHFCSVCDKDDGAGASAGGKKGKDGKDGKDGNDDDDDDEAGGDDDGGEGGGARRENMVTSCVTCPTAYHIKCMPPAGVIRLTRKLMYCPSCAARAIGSDAGRRAIFLCEQAVPHTWLRARRRPSGRRKPAQRLSEEDRREEAEGGKRRYVKKDETEEQARARQTLADAALKVKLERRAQRQEVSTLRVLARAAKKAPYPPAGSVVKTYSVPGRPRPLLTVDGVLLQRVVFKWPAEDESDGDAAENDDEDGESSGYETPDEDAAAATGAAPAAATADADTAAGANAGASAGAESAAAAAAAGADADSAAAAPTTGTATKKAAAAPRRRVVESVPIKRAKLPPHAVLVSEVTTQEPLADDFVVPRLRKVRCDVGVKRGARKGKGAAAATTGAEAEAGAGAGAAAAGDGDGSDEEAFEDDEDEDGSDDDGGDDDDVAAVPAAKPVPARKSAGGRKRAADDAAAPRKRATGATAAAAAATNAGDDDGSDDSADESS
jgi:superfamily II DNA or RNA helicase